MINLIKAIVKRIKAFITLHRMNYEMKKSQNCLTLIIEAILAGSIYPYEDEIMDELIVLEGTGISLASDLTLMFNCLLYLEDLEDVTVDDYVDWTTVMKSVAYINKGVKLLSDAVVWGNRVRKVSRLSTNQVIYLDKYSDIVHYLLCKSKVNHALMEQI